MDQPSQEDFVRQVPLFADLTAKEIADLVRSSQLLFAAAGERIIEEGAPGDSMFIVLDGELEVTKREGNRDILLTTRKRGEFLGEMSLLEQAPRSASVRAVRQSTLLAIGPQAFQTLLRDRPAAATTLLRTVAGRLRSTEASLVQADKLASLGTLAAGLAHELNNPAAAIQRSTGYLRSSMRQWHERTASLSGNDAYSDEERAGIRGLEGAILDGGGEPLPSREESRIEDWLEARSIADPWDLAPPLAAGGWSAERLSELSTTFAAEHVAEVVGWLAAGFRRSSCCMKSTSVPRRFRISSGR